MAAIGMGSQLVYRAKEAMMRANTARLLGITKPVGVAVGINVPGNARPSPATSGQITSAQPPQAASLDVPDDQKALRDVENFLAGLTPEGKRKSAVF